MTSDRRVLLRTLSSGAAVLILTGCSSRLKPVGVAAPPPPIRFRDVTAEAGIDARRVNGAFGQHFMPETMGGGGAFFDYDNDGWLDILLVNGDWWPGHPLPGPRPTLKLYRNTGVTDPAPNAHRPTPTAHRPTPTAQHPTPTAQRPTPNAQRPTPLFEDVTREAGLNVSMQGMGAAAGDYDNDGYDDLYVTGIGGNRLFHNEAGGTNRVFRDVTPQAGMGGSGWSTSAAWLDYDQDGWLDLFVCHYVRWSPETNISCGTLHPTYCHPRVYPGESCRLYRNTGSSRFVDVTREAGLYNENSKALGVCVSDLNGDRRPDVVVANDTQPNFVYLNEGHGVFVERGDRTGIALSEDGAARAGMGIDTADYRNDGTQGLAIGNFVYEGIAFYEIENAEPYAERAKEAGLYVPSYPYITFGLFFGDFDNDGWPDLFATNGHIEDAVERVNPGQSYAQPSLLFRNRGDGGFEDVSRAAGECITRRVVGRGACRGDFDNDGRLDVLMIPNFGMPALLRNETESRHHWLSLKLTGTKSNRSGLGATVAVEAGGRRQTAYARSGSSYLSSSDPRLFFGLGASTRVDRVTVDWPGGLVETWGSLPADQIVRLTEGSGLVPRQ